MARTFQKPKEKPEETPAPDDESDVEIEGMDLDQDDVRDRDEDDSQGNEEKSAPSATSDSDLDENAATLAQDDHRDLEEAQKERQELMEASKQSDETVNPEDRLQYLLAQSDVFAHFLAGSVAAGSKKKKKKGAGGGEGRRGNKRMTEEEEDSQMLKAAQSKRRIVRLEKQPSNLADHCKMHPYQLEGLNWLIRLHDHGINGILADEMGLGKTLQTISLLAYLREVRGVRGPHLVVVPKSVVGNWIREFNKWCPCIKAVKMLGDKESRKKVIAESMPLDKNGKRKFDVLVTSYEGVLKERSLFAKINWEYFIIDEAHRIKNENSSLSKAVRTMNTRFRLLITGTPLQNNLHELWALLNFLLPDIFGDAEQFDQWFSLSDDNAHGNVIRKLHTVLRPFMLRRVKKDVACDLPSKKETKLFIGLTPMQQELYTRVLRKDAHELNSLGGPDKGRLQNILMQLRKVCNHPYLFDGAEPGPPYYDGPHLWENSGKMLLLNKLLPKLKAAGSRVLIFSQMTRVLDILEDYLRHVHYDYCRIDGNTSGESRDSQMEVFNEDGSSKFVFLLSTRAGGLGINLATADIVILYDSDWNPQVDLQAMDRSHRIGQKKPVQVFRFVTEGSVEEKIIERADKKLFLDAAVIQQGRLAEQFVSADKKELMQMVRFGADQILSGKGGTYTDEDIDALIAKGEEKTSQMQAKLQTNAQHSLADFSLSGKEDKDTFNFDGKNYRDENKDDTGNFINLPQRERKRNYDVNEYYREAMNTGGGSTVKVISDIAAKKRKKGVTIMDFQFYNKPRLDAITEIERDLVIRRDCHINQIKELRNKAKVAPSVRNSRNLVSSEGTCEHLLRTADLLETQFAQFEMPKALLEEKEKLHKEAFIDWSRKDFKSFCSSLERHGRFSVDNVAKDVAHECAKDEADVKRYFVAFWTGYKRIADWKKILERIERGEKKIIRMKQIREAIREKVDDCLRNLHGPLPWENDDQNAIDQSNAGVSQKLPQDTKANDLLDNAWQRMKINYAPGAKSRIYTEEEDAFLICMMYRHGYAGAARIRMEIRRAWQFRFDWYFKSRSVQEIQKRCDSLIKVIEREQEEIRRKEHEEDQRLVIEGRRKKQEAALENAKKNRGNMTLGGSQMNAMANPQINALTRPAANPLVLNQ